MTQKITLYHYWRSSCSWRVRWALAIKGVTYESKTVNLLEGKQKAPEFLRVNPAGLVPTLVVDGTPYSESMAMLEWIEETYPRPSLLPQSPTERMRARQLCQMIASGTQPLQNLGPMRYFSRDEKAQKEWARHWIREGLSKFEEVLARVPSGSFCCGGAVTFADLCLVPQMYNAQRFELDLNLFPRGKRIYEHCLTLPECDQAAPHNQPQT